MSGKKEKKEQIKNLRGKTTKNEDVKCQGKKEKKEAIENHMKPKNQIIK